MMIKFDFFLCANNTPVPMKRGTRSAPSPTL
jgi:hypothetical protein